MSEMAIKIVRGVRMVAAVGTLIAFTEWFRTGEAYDFNATIILGSIALTVSVCLLYIRLRS